MREKKMIEQRTVAEAMLNVMMMRDPNHHRRLKNTFSSKMQCNAAARSFCFSNIPQPTYPASVVPTHGAGVKLERGRHRRAAPRLHEKSRDPKSDLW